MAELSVYASLFLTALAAATILPLQSETVLGGLLAANAYPSWKLLTVASSGNVIGSLVNWLLGRSIENCRHKRWFPFKKKSLDRAQSRYNRFGKWTLLLSWAPLIGDPLTVAAGMMRTPLLPFLGIVALAKTARYLVVAYLVLP